MRVLNRLLVVLALLGAPALHAQSHWTNSVGGNFTNSANWLTTVPIHNGTAVFTNNGDYTVNFSATTNTLNAYFTTNTSGTVTLDMTGFQWRVGNEFVVGRALGSTATVAVAGGTLFVTNLARTAVLTVGDAGAGSMLVTAGTVRASNLILGRTSTGLGSLVVSGGSTVFSNSNAAIIGDASSGNSLVLTGGAKMFATNFIIGAQVSAHSNTVTITGSNTQLVKPLNGAFTVGDLGSWNQLTVTDSGYVASSNSFIVGRQSGADFNSLVVSDNGSLESRVQFVIGDFGKSNSLVIAGGGTVITGIGGGSSRGHIGRNVGGDHNFVLVTGSGSLFTNGVGLTVGGGGAYNRMVISNGATVVAVDTSIVGSNSVGNSVLVTGNGSSWTTTALRIGFESAANSNSVTVTGDGAKLIKAVGAAAEIRVGDNGSWNSLTVTNNGYVFSGNTVYVGTTGNSNSLTITSGGSLDSAAHLVVGHTNSIGNMLTISAGGVALSGSANQMGIIGRFDGSDFNHVVVTGNNSLWSNRTDFVVGQKGANNSLLITNGGRVEVGNNATVGWSTSASGNSVTVAGNGATWLVGQTLTVGATGAVQNVTIGNGGFLTAGAIVLGQHAGAASTLTLNTGGMVTNQGTLILASENISATGNVVMTGGTWIQAGQSTIGRFGRGTLTMDGGQFLQTGLMIVGSNGTIFGTVNLNTGSKLVIDGGGAGGLIIGNRGGATGNLNINGGTLIISNLATTTAQGLNTNGVFVGFGNGSGTAGGQGTLIFTAGTVTNYGHLVIANNLGTSANNSAGVFTQTGGNWVQNEQMQVGRTGTGTLTISGGQLEINSLLLVGGTLNTTGTMWVVGNDAVVSISDRLALGRQSFGRFIVSNGTVTVGANITLGEVNASANAGLIVAGGSVATASNVVMGSSAAGLASVLVTSGGVLESRGLVMSNTLSTASFITNHGGILQFTTAAPQILPRTATSIVVTNGTIAFRAIDDANVKANWGGGNQLSNIVYRGDNTFRLNAASNTTVNQSYTFAAGLGATNYSRLELINSHTAYRGGNVTIGTTGTMLVSNTTATITGVFTNSGSLSFVNANATFQSRVYNSGTSTMLNSIGTFNSGVINAGRWVTDPTTNVFQSFGLTNTTSGVISMGAGDVYIFANSPGGATADFINVSTNNVANEMLPGKFLFSGGLGLTQTFAVAGLDLGPAAATATNQLTSTGGEFVSNFALGTLEISNFSTVRVTDAFSLLGPGAEDGLTAGLYLENLFLGANSLLIIDTNVQVYFRHSNNWSLANIRLINNQGIGGDLYSYDNSISGLHQLTVIPEPSVLLLVAGGLVTMYFVRRRGSRHERGSA